MKTRIIFFENADNSELWKLNPLSLTKLYGEKVLNWEQSYIKKVVTSETISLSRGKIVIIILKSEKEVGLLVYGSNGERIK
ncbi:MAG: hypothetical protein QXP04_00365 [Candidatus Nanoarchaeia archaeon]|nr:hypothetical protein [Candidatus Jingweiarchaeum tengchongense]